MSSTKRKKKRDLLEEMGIERLPMEELRKRLNIREVTIEEHIEELRPVVAEYEQRYGCSSHEMAEAVRSGEVYDTRDIDTWLSHYRYLTMLEGPPPRYCTCCDVVKTVADFSRNARNSDGYQDWCKKCNSEDRRLRKTYMRVTVEMIRESLGVH